MEIKMSFAVAELLVFGCTSDVTPAGANLEAASILKMDEETIASYRKEAKRMVWKRYYAMHTALAALKSVMG